MSIMRSIMLNPLDQGGGLEPIVLDYPTIYIMGASLEQHGDTGQQSQSRFGHSPNSIVNWANELDGVRLFDQNSAINNADYPYFSPPTNYAQSGSGWLLQGSGSRPSIIEQVDTVLSEITSTPVGKRLAYISGGRNEVGTMSVADYMTNFNTQIARLLDVADLIIVPGLWLRDTSVGGVWASAGQARQDVLDINTAIAASVSGNSKIIFVPLIDVMNEASGDRNPKAGYVQSDGTHFMPIGSMAGGRAVRDAIIGRLTPQAFGTETNLAPDLSGTGGTLTNATGSVADAYTLIRSGTGPTIVGSKDGDAQVISVTRATSQTPPWSGFSFETLAASRVSVSPGNTYRARAKIVIDPTPVPVSLAFFASEFLSTTAVQRVVGRWHMLSGSAETPTNLSNGTSLQPIDASGGLTLWLETPDIPIISTSGEISIGTYVQLTAQQGAAATVTVRIEELEVSAA